MRRLVLLPAVLLVTACVTSGESGPVYEAYPKQAALANLQLGSEYLQRGELERALDKLMRAVEQDPELGAAHAYLGLTFEQMGRADEAGRHYRTAARLGADDPAVLNMYGVYLCRTDRVAEAERQFTAAIAIATYSTPETALTNAGICQLRVPDVERAEHYFREALKRNPRYPDALWRMARLTHEDDRDFQARAFLQRLAAVTRLSAPALWLGYQVESNLGNARDAERYGQQLIADYPESVEAALLDEAR